MSADSLKSLFTDFKERASNPFISSFIISWLFWNWKVTFLTINFLTDSNSNISWEKYVDLVLHHTSFLILYIALTIRIPLHRSFPSVYEWSPTSVN